MASMILPEYAFTPEAYRLYALTFIFHFLKSVYSMSHPGFLWT